jgi:hypothetical protein
MNLANEGFEARKKEEEVATKKRKAEEDARWEGDVLPSRTITLGGSSHLLYRKPRTARGQLAQLRQHIEKEEKAEGRCSWLRSYSRFSIRAVSVLVHITPW